MADVSANNKRIAKNTLFLYFRMLFMMLISLYTSRVVLNTLGVEDYGIYNVVGGVVATFSIISGSLSAAISRFITFDLGKGDEKHLKRTFVTSVNVQFSIAILVLILGETIGVWFLNSKMNIPVERMDAANWVLHCSLVAFAINLISVPYNSCIIAHEHMKAFAYVSIIEAIGKLVIVYLLCISPIDKLIFYAILMCMIALIIRAIYGIYCKRHFKECTYQFMLDKDLLRKMFGFAGWNFIGASSTVLRDQGGNIVINLFCGPTVNAARGIAFQVNTAVQGFVSNFMTAVNPQITKSYASGEKEYMMTLIFQGARLSFYMLLFISLPVLINTNYILTLWLKTVPEHTVFFVQLSLLFGMSESISNPLITAMLATGRIRNYQLVVGGLQMMNLPASYILLRVGMFPEVVMIIAIIISQICLAARLFMLRKMIDLPVLRYMKKVYVNVLVVTLVSCIFPFFLAYKLEDSFLNFLFLCFVSVICTSISIYYIGCNRNERKFVMTKLCSIKNKLVKR